MLTRRALGLLAPLLATPPAGAQPAMSTAEWPDRPVRIIVPFGPGGAPDIQARLMSQHFPALAHGQPLLVENRPGAGGTIGGATTAQARPDGHTLLIGELGTTVLATELYRNLPYDPRSLTPVIFLAALPMLVTVRNSLPAETVQEFLTYARGKPGGVTYGTVGAGHIGQLTGEVMVNQAGGRVVPVTYRSGAEVLTALARGDIDFSILSMTSGMPGVQSGSVRALAVTTAERLPALPHLPPLAATIPGLVSTLWYALVGPANMPTALVARMNAVFNQVLAVPEFRAAMLQQQGTTPIGGPPERLAQHLAEETARWVPVLRAAGVRPE
jgi:tripartite-type tricarboxylate transporter receptor subunit TctC